MATDEDIEYYPFRWKLADAAEDVFTLHRGKLIIGMLLFFGGIGAGLFLLGGGDSDVETTTAPAIENSDEFDGGTGNEDEQAPTTSTTDAPTTTESTAAPTTTAPTTSTTTTTTTEAPESTRPPASAAEILAAQPGNIVLVQPGVVRLVGGLPSEANAQETIEQAARVFGDDVEIVDEQIVDDSFPVPDGSLVFRLSAPNLFGYLSDNINTEYLPAIDQLASALQENEAWNVTVTGHTDASGPAEGNQRLSQERAQAGANRLVAQGVDSGRITVVGRGEDEPIASNDTDAGKELNRRIEFIVQ